MRYKTYFKFFKRTPLTDLKNTIYFNDNTERDNFFNKHYERVEVTQPFNFIKDRLVLRVEGDYKDFKEVNYCSFKSEFDDTTYYCFIPEYFYINDNVIELHLLIDGIMTYCQGGVLDNLKGLSITRQHLSINDYEDNLDYIKNNDDVIKTYTKKYFNEEVQQFELFNILIHSTVDLSQSFGDKNNPTISSSSGCRFDDISSPVDMYIVAEKDFNQVMNKLQAYPWITQNFKKIIQIPIDILDIQSPEVISVPVVNPDMDLTPVKKIIGGRSSNYSLFMKNIEKTYKKLLNDYGLTEEDEHLLRNEYTTLELYNWNGQQLLLDCGQIDRFTGLKFGTVTIGGYANELAIYVRGYKGKNFNNSSFLNDALFFKDFDDIPILVDNYNLALAKNANQRKLSESNLLTGKVKRIIGNENDLQDRLVSAVSIFSNISPMKLGQGLVDEHEFYRSQKASEMDLALDSPTITNQTVTNALGRKNGFYGVTLKQSRPSDMEMEKVKNYYKLYGYQVDTNNTMLSNPRSMTLCNYVEFKGNFTIRGVERSILDMIKIQFENGVRLWHNKDIPNPFIQDIKDNIKRRF